MPADVVGSCDWGWVLGGVSRTVGWRSWGEDGRLRITFHGAARQVTGTAHLLEIDRYRILLDYGLFDSNRTDPDSPNRQFAFDPRDLDAVIVSHAHNDHIGRLPCLVRAGYTGPIYATARHRRHHERDAPRQCRISARTRGTASSSNGHDALDPLFELVDVEWVVEKLQRLAVCHAYRDPARE